jgi:ligand-binding SRPBCC domain-containing protein
MTVHWHNSAIIDRPVEEVWEEFSDLFSAPRLPGSSMSLRQTSPGPMGLGTTIQARRVILGFETRLIETITEWDPPRAMSVTIEGRPFRSFVERVTLEPTTGGTLVTDKMDFELRLALRLIWPLLGPFMGRQRRQQWRDLKVKLETEPLTHPG